MIDAAVLVLDAIEGMASLLSYVVVNSGGMLVYVPAVLLSQLALYETRPMSHITIVKLVCSTFTII